jgi:hypothetical protein
MSTGLSLSTNETVTMKKMTVYGLPLNPMPLLEQLRGASFCVSYGTRDKLGKQLEQAIDCVGKDQMLLVDNGAYSAFQSGVDTMNNVEYLDGFAEWASDILDRCPQAVAIIPDKIDGNEEDNRQLALESLGMFDHTRAMGVWHMHESIDYLIWLCESFGHVGIGSSGEYLNYKKPSWTARIKEAMAAIDAWEAEPDAGNVRPRIHMLKVQSKHHLFDFDSSDSVNVSMNHGRYRKQGEGHVGRLAKRVDDRIQRSAGPEAPHQIARPLDEHVQQYNEDLARATAPGATEADVWMFTYRHGPLPKTAETEERELVALLTAAGYAVSVTDTPAQYELPLAA